MTKNYLMQAFYGLQTLFSAIDLKGKVKITIELERSEDMMKVEMELHNGLRDVLAFRTGQTEQWSLTKGEIMGIGYEFTLPKCPCCDRPIRR